MDSQGWRAAIEQLVAEVEKAERWQLEQVVANLGTATDIAREHGFASDAIVYNYRVRYLDTPDPFPEPVTRFGRIDVYWLPAARVWMKAHKRKSSTINKSEGRSH